MGEQAKVTTAEAIAELTLDFKGEYITRRGLVATVEKWDGTKWEGTVRTGTHPQHPGCKSPTFWDEAGNSIENNGFDLMQGVMPKE